MENLQQPMPPGGVYQPMPYTGFEEQPPEIVQRHAMEYESIRRQASMIGSQIIQQVSGYISQLGQQFPEAYKGLEKTNRMIAYLSEIRDILQGSLAYLRTISGATVGMHANLMRTVGNLAGYTGLAPTFGGYSGIGIGTALLSSMQRMYTGVFGYGIQHTYSGLRNFAIATGMRGLYNIAGFISTPLTLQEITDTLMPYMITGAIRGNIGTVLYGTQMMTPEVGAGAIANALLSAPGRLSTAQLTAYVNRFVTYANQVSDIIGAPPEAILGFIANLQNMGMFTPTIMTGLATAPLRFGGGTLEGLMSLLGAAQEIYKIPGLGGAAGLYQAIGAMAAFPFDFRRQQMAMTGLAYSTVKLGGGIFQEFLPLAVAAGKTGNLIDIITGGAAMFAQNPLLMRGLSGITGMFLNPLGVARAMQSPIRFYSQILYGTEDPTFLQTINILQNVAGLDFETAYATALAYQGADVATVLAQLQATPIMGGIGVGAGFTTRFMKGFSFGVSPILGVAGAAANALIQLAPAFFILRGVGSKILENVYKSLGIEKSDVDALLKGLRRAGARGFMRLTQNVLGDVAIARRLTRGIFFELPQFIKREFSPINTLKGIARPTLTALGGGIAVGVSTGLATSLFGEEIAANPLFQFAVNAGSFMAAAGGLFGLQGGLLGTAIGSALPFVTGLGIWGFNRVRNAIFGRDITLTGMTPLEATAFIKSVSRGEITSGDPFINQSLKLIRQAAQGKAVTGSSLFNLFITTTSGEFQRLAQALANYDPRDPRQFMEASLTLQTVIGGILQSNGIDPTKLSWEDKARLGSFLYSTYVARGIDEKIARGAISKAGLRISEKDVSATKQASQFLSTLVLSGKKEITAADITRLVNMTGSPSLAIGIIQQFQSQGLLQIRPEDAEKLIKTLGAEGLSLLTEKQRKDYLISLVSRTGKLDRGKAADLTERIAQLLSAGISQEQVIEAIKSEFKMTTEQAREIVTAIQTTRLYSDARGPAGGTATPDEIANKLSTSLDKLAQVLDKKLK